jgi:SP family general alpha glucoside:H+ symporter-like MFS transporter
LAKVGRRPIYILGTLASVLANIPIGALGFAKSSSSVNYGISALMILINFTFHMSIGPVCYTIVGELPASRLRARSIVFGRFVYVINGLIVGSINPYLTTYLNAKAGLFWAGTGLLCVLWGFFRLPETGGFTFAELDILFANKVPSRRFKRVVVRDALAEETSSESAERIKEKGSLVPKDQLPIV